MNLELKKLNKKLSDLSNTYIVFNQQALDLRDSFKAIFPAKKCPVFLYRDSKAKSPLYWRYSSVIHGKLGDRVKVADSGVSEFWGLLKNMNANDKAKLYEFEIKRLELNYELSTISYQVARIMTLIDGVKNWEVNIRKIL